MYYYDATCGVIIYKSPGWAINSDVVESASGQRRKWLEPRGARRGGQSSFPNPGVSKKFPACVLIVQHTHNGQDTKATAVITYDEGEDAPSQARTATEQEI